MTDKWDLLIGALIRRKASIIPYFRLSINSLAFPACVPHVPLSHYCSLVLSWTRCGMGRVIIRRIITYSPVVGKAWSTLLKTSICLCSVTHIMSKCFIWAPNDCSVSSSDLEKFPKINSQNKNRLLLHFSFANHFSVAEKGIKMIHAHKLFIWPASEPMYFWWFVKRIVMMGSRAEMREGWDYYNYYVVGLKLIMVLTGI